MKKSYGTNEETVQLCEKGQTVVDVEFNPLDPFQENYSSNFQFWDKVSVCHKQNPHIEWSDIETKFRLEALEERYENKDLLVELITTVHDGFLNYAQSNDKMEMMDSFLNRLYIFSIILLDEDYYGCSILEPRPEASERKDANRSYAQSPVLHLTVERNLCQIVKKYLQFYPGKVYAVHERQIPVDVALQAGGMVNRDQVCALLIRRMICDRVRDLFADLKDASNGAKHSFGELIQRGDMKESVLAVLNKCVEPNDAFAIQDNREVNNPNRITEIWSKEPGIPLRYNFFFRLLDGDSKGRPPFEEDEGRVKEMNTEFQVKSKSALHCITNRGDRTDEQDPLRHPVVRQLIRRKWNLYGRQCIILQACLYMVFLLCMSLAFYFEATSHDPRTYQTNKDHLRLAFEVFTIIFSLFYAVCEIEQLYSDPQAYKSDWVYNTLDFLGIFLILLMIPLQLTQEYTVERGVSAFAFLINVFRVFKFLPVFEDYGVYAKTFAQIMYTDIRKFAIVFSVVLLAFTGTISLAITADPKFLDNENTANVTRVSDVLMKGIRALFEGKEFADGYNHLSWTTYMVLFEMFVVIVVMANILIGQVSYRYEIAMQEAAVQLDVDKAKMVASLEQFWFTKSQRVKHYKDGIFVSNTEMEEEFWNYWKSTEQQEEEKKSVIKILKTRILKKKDD